MKNCMPWFVYIAQCKDQSLYTGITKNLKQRLSEHNGESHKGAKSLRGKRPVHLVYNERYKTKSEALKREKEIQSWKREHKLKLITK